MRSIRLRRGLARGVAHPLNQLSRSTVNDLGRELAVFKLRGAPDLTGASFQTAWANALSGKSCAGSEGLDDVSLNGTGWSCKTVHIKNPLTSRAKVRLVVGRCSPEYSAGSTAGTALPEVTGEIVLSIFNARIANAISKYGDMRLVWCRRNFESMEFVVVEERLAEVVVGDYIWSKAKTGTLQGVHRGSGFKEWVWQPHGGQLSRLRPVPSGAARFRVNIGVPVPLVPRDEILRRAGWDPSWVDLL